LASTQRPGEIRELLERPEYNWEPGPEDIPVWFDVWTWLSQILFWGLPTGLKRTSSTVATSEAER
jgi:hypothetical protein